MKLFFSSVIVLASTACTLPIQSGEPAPLDPSPSTDTGATTACEEPFLSYFDADNDGFGDDKLWVEACALPPGHVETPGDCNDLDASVSPGAIEACNERDDDCDGQIDEDLERTPWYPDEDRDGYGDSERATAACEAPGEGWIAEGGDCDDANADSSPGASERLNQTDDNCSGEVDDLTTVDAHGRVNGDAPHSRLGTALAGGFDFDGDGLTDALVGAPGEARAFIHSGAMDGGESDSSTAIVTLNAESSDGGFGHAVAFTHDIDGDSFADVVIGEPWVATETDGVGRVTFYMGLYGESDGTIVTAVDAVPGEELGSVIAYMGAGHGSDDTARVAVTGTSKVFGHDGVLILEASYRSGTGSVHTVTEIGGTAADDGFGAAIAGHVDINGDGLHDLAVGAPEAMHGDETQPGAIHVFLAPMGDSLSASEADHTVYGLNDGDEFGAAVTDADDWDNDGWSDLLIGAPGHGGSAGLVYVLSGSDFVEAPTTAESATATLGGGIGRLGAAIAATGDADGDGDTDIVVGAPQNDTAGPMAGAAFVYWSGKTTGSHTHDASIESDAPGAQLGSALSAIVDTSSAETAFFVVGGWSADAFDDAEAEFGSVWWFSTE